MKGQNSLADNHEFINSSVGLFAEYKAEHEKEKERLRWEQEQLARKEAELEARMLAAEADNQRLREEMKRNMRINKGKSRDSSERGSLYTDNPTEYSTDGDVKMREWYVPRYEEKVPTFDNKGVDLEGFREKCLRHFNRYPRDYEGDTKAQVSFIEDHLDGEVLRWYRVRERIRQRSNPDVELLFAHIHERFPPESPIEVSRTKLLKLRHEWGKAYEYLAEFNELTDVLNLPENVRRQVLIQQVRPSVREAFYEIEDKQRDLENLTEKLLQCDTHPEAYKNDYLEKIDVRRDHQIILMALLDVIDPCKPSKQANMR